VRTFSRCGSSWCAYVCRSSSFFQSSPFSSWSRSKVSSITPALIIGCFRTVGSIVTFWYPCAMIVYSWMIRRFLCDFGWLEARWRIAQTDTWHEIPSMNSSARFCLCLATHHSLPHRSRLRHTFSSWIVVFVTPARWYCPRSHSDGGGALSIVQAGIPANETPIRNFKPSV
jgi:hypothetical protein